MDERQRDDEDKRRESGQPGGGRGRRDEVGRTGIWPASGPLPEGDATTIGQGELGQGTRGAAGYEDSGSSEVWLTKEELEEARKRREGEEAPSADQREDEGGR